MIVEDPTYPAALQAWGMYEPVFCPVPTNSDGITCAIANGNRAWRKLVYCMPNFQNPTGISYTPSDEPRWPAFCGTLDRPRRGRSIRSPRFSGSMLPPIACHLPEHSVLLGTFSRTFAPGFGSVDLCSRSTDGKGADRQTGGRSAFGESRAMGHSSPRHQQKFRAAFAGDQRRLGQAMPNDD